MKNVNRDLLVLTKLNSLDAKAMEREINGLNKLLYAVENLHTFCIVNEIINLNSYKIIQKPYKIQQMIREGRIKPFVFIFNKN